MCLFLRGDPLKLRAAIELNLEGVIGVSFPSLLQRKAKNNLPSGKELEDSLSFGGEKGVLLKIKKSMAMSSKRRKGG